MVVKSKIPPPVGIKTQSDMLGNQISEMFWTCYKDILGLYKFTNFTYAELF
jgi:hypothetical protein